MKWILNVIQTGTKTSLDDWGWEAEHTLQRGIKTTRAEVTKKKMTKWLRDNGYLTPESAGNIAVQLHMPARPIEKQWVLIRDRFTREPLYIFRREP